LNPDVVVVCTERDDGAAQRRVAAAYDSNDVVRGKRLARHLDMSREAPARQRAGAIVGRPPSGKQRRAGARHTQKDHWQLPLVVRRGGSRRRRADASHHLGRELLVKRLALPGEQHDDRRRPLRDDPLQASTDAFLGFQSTSGRRV
jgi:hypothetical protein